ncbi:MAG TPA: dienelactone hydrolase family protein [Blastocatellia bacterium]|nr:dienelactone hydrolase family protein [Blastocatellia bacterium]
MPLAGYDEFKYSHDSRTRTVFRKGNGPAVVVIHEVPGITPEVARFADRVAAAGLTVFLPCLFGTPGRPASTPYILKELGRVCISREFYCLAEKRSSPITDWLRALCRHAHGACGGPGVGAIGMCLTGNFALALMVDEVVMAPVLSQPSLPFPTSASKKSALAISDNELEVVKSRTAQGCGVLGLRFTEDRGCPPERFAALRHHLGSGFDGIEIDSSPQNAWGIKQTAHSVLTADLVDEAGHPTREALDRVLAFFQKRLLTSS